MTLFGPPVPNLFDGLRDVRAQCEHMRLHVGAEYRRLLDSGTCRP
jgi:hypothetical protein